MKDLSIFAFCLVSLLFLFSSCQSDNEAIEGKIWSKNSTLKVAENEYKILKCDFDAQGGVTIEVAANTKIKGKASAFHRFYIMQRENLSGRNKTVFLYDLMGCDYNYLFPDTLHSRTEVLSFCHIDSISNGSTTLWVFCPRLLELWGNNHNFNYSAEVGVSTIEDGLAKTKIPNLVEIYKTLRRELADAPQFKSANHRSDFWDSKNPTLSVSEKDYDVSVREADAEGGIIRMYNPDNFLKYNGATTTSQQLFVITYPRLDEKGTDDFSYQLYTHKIGDRYERSKIDTFHYKDAGDIYFCEIRGHKLGNDPKDTSNYIITFPKFSGELVFWNGTKFPSGKDTLYARTIQNALAKTGVPGAVENYQALLREFRTVK